MQCQFLGFNDKSSVVAFSQGGKQEMVKRAAALRRDLASRCNLQLAEIDAFVLEFSQMRKMMKSNMKVSWVKRFD